MKAYHHESTAWEIHATPSGYLVVDFKRKLAKVQPGRAKNSTYTQIGFRKKSDAETFELMKIWMNTLKLWLKFWKEIP